MSRAEIALAKLPQIGQLLRSITRLRPTTSESGDTILQHVKQGEERAAMQNAPPPKCRFTAAQRTLVG